MSLRSQYEFLFVGRDEGSFVENYAYDLGEGGENSGKIFINLEIQNNPVDAEMIGETIFDALRKTFYVDLDQDPYVRFEESIRAVNNALVQLRDEKVSKYIGNLNVIISVIVGNILYLTQTGEAEAYMIRRRLSSTISEGLNEETENEMFTNIASGSLEPGDFVVFSSTRLLRYISKNDLSRICSGNHLVSSLGELKEYLSTEVLSKIGIIGVVFQESEPSLSDDERGQIVEHLEKEEVYNNDKRVRRSGANSKAVSEILGSLINAVNDLGRKVAGMASSGTNRSSGAEIRSARADRGTAAFDIRRWGKDRILVSLIIVILALTAGIWWMKIRADEQQKVEQYATMLNEVQEEVSSATTTGAYNKDQAGQMLSHAEQKAIEVLNSGYNRSKANELLQSIQETRDSLDGVFHPELRVLADLAEKRANVSAIGLLGLNDTLYVYEYNALYPVTLDTVQDPLTIDDNEVVTMGAAYDDQDSLLFNTKSGKLIEYKDGRMSFVDTADGSFKNGVAIQGYSNKFYILSPDDNQIYRYVRRKDTFDSVEEWNVNAELADAVSFAIDGNVYVLKSTGDVVKIFSGNQETFSLKKAPINEMENPTKIYTALDLNQIFILEPSKQRVLIFDKDTRTGDAVFNKQLVFDDLTDLRDMYFDIDTSRLYLVDQSKVYEVAL